MAKKRKSTPLADGSSKKVSIESGTLAPLVAPVPAIAVLVPAESLGRPQVTMANPAVETVAATATETAPVAPQTPQVATAAPVGNTPPKASKLTAKALAMIPLMKRPGGATLRELMAIYETTMPHTVAAFLSNSEVSVFAKMGWPIPISAKSTTPDKLDRTYSLPADAVVDPSRIRASKAERAQRQPRQRGPKGDHKLLGLFEAAQTWMEQNGATGMQVLRDFDRAIAALYPNDHAPYPQARPCLDNPQAEEPAIA